MKKILTIAGSDSSGGAGVQADIKTITILGGYASSVITALTAQNTQGVKGTLEVSPSFVEKQIEVVLTDIGADAVKIGMLANASIVSVVSKKIREHSIKKVIIDPVMISKSGHMLLSKGAQKTLISYLLPLAYLVTPNIYEASALTGKEIKNIKEMRKAAETILRMGPKSVLIKGGHLESNQSPDILYDGKKFSKYTANKIETQNTHGTGCSYAAAIATFIAQGNSIPKAVSKAKHFISDAIRFSLNIGKGRGPINPYAWVGREIVKYRVIEDLKAAVGVLRQKSIGQFIPEVRSNLGFALPYAQSPEDVAAIPGRITAFKNSIAISYDPEFGASRHISRVILTAMKYDPDMRSAMNIRFNKDIIERCKSLKFKVRSFERQYEPKEIKEKEGLSLAWGVESVIEKENVVPDIIFDRGDVGKEPMIRVMGRDPGDVVRKILKIGGL